MLTRILGSGPSRAPSRFSWRCSGVVLPCTAFSQIMPRGKVLYLGPKIAIISPSLSIVPSDSAQRFGFGGGPSAPRAAYSSSSGLGELSQKSSNSSSAIMSLSHRKSEAAVFIEEAVGELVTFGVRAGIVREWTSE